MIDHPPPSPRSHGARQRAAGLPGLFAGVLLVLNGCASTVPPADTRIVLPEIGGAVRAVPAPTSLEDLEDRLGIAPAEEARSSRPAPAELEEMGAAPAASDRNAERAMRVERVARAIGPEEVARIVEVQAARITALGTIPAGALSEDHEVRLSRAAALAGAAVSQLERGDDAGALDRALASADLLIALTPRALARSYILRAEEVLRRESVDAPYDAQERGRAERLLIGAREAWNEGEAEHAMQRAYYACLILGVEIR